MKQEQSDQIRFEIKGWINAEVKAYGIPELEGKTGVCLEENMAMFWGNGYEMYIVNTKTCKMRKFSDADGNVLVSLDEIDMDSINRGCEHGAKNAMMRVQRYGRINRFSDFRGGVAALCWTIYPDGRYFEDEDGYGGESNNEECIYCIINRDLEIIYPFSWVPDIRALLKEMSSKK